MEAYLFSFGVTMKFWPDPPPSPRHPSPMYRCSVRSVFVYCSALFQETEFFFPMGCASQSGGGGGSASDAGGGPQQRYVVGVLPANKLGECVEGIAQMVG